MKKKTIYIVVILVTVLALFAVFRSSAQTAVKVGDTVPSFVLNDQFGEAFDMDSHIGKTAMVIYFYPKDDTPGCTKEACKFRDSYQEFTDKDIKVIGISSDDVESHKNFAEKYDLPFTLLADIDNEVRNQFGVKGNVLGLIPGRVTYVIDKSGKVVFMYESQLKAERHIEESINAINKTLK